MNASAPSVSPSTRHAPLALWRVAEAFMHTLYNLFGAPEDVAADHTLTRKPYDLLLSWIRCAEAMLRRLLLIEASAIVPPASSRQTKSASKAARVRKLRYFTSDNPEAWRVSFRCFLGPPASRRHAPVSAGETPEAKRFLSAWPLAERYEAILRVFNDPAPYARRLARTLRAAPKRIAELLRAPAEATHRVDDFEAMGYSGEARWKQTRDTS